MSRGSLTVLRSQFLCHSDKFEVYKSCGLQVVPADYVYRDNKRTYQRLDEVSLCKHRSLVGCSLGIVLSYSSLPSRKSKDQRRARKVLVWNFLTVVKNKTPKNWISHAPIFILILVKREDS